MFRGLFGILAAFFSFVLGIVAAIITFFVLMPLLKVSVAIMLGITFVIFLFFIIGLLFGRENIRRCFYEYGPALLFGIIGTIVMAIIAIVTILTPLNLIAAIIIGILVFFFAFFLIVLVALILCLIRQIYHCQE